MNEGKLNTNEKVLFECYNCGAIGIFKNIWQFRKDVLPKCPVCGIEERGYIYSDNHYEEYLTIPLLKEDYKNICELKKMIEDTQM